MSGAEANSTPKALRLMTAMAMSTASTRSVLATQ